MNEVLIKREKGGSGKRVGLLDRYG